jgi:hypothetical protein
MQPFFSTPYGGESMDTKEVLELVKNIARAVEAVVDIFTD